MVRSRTSLAPCASDGDCANPFGAAQCLCGACCVPTGSSFFEPLPCSVCCSGMCASAAQYA